MTDFLNGLSPATALLLGGVGGLAVGAIVATYLARRRRLRELDSLVDRWLASRLGRDAGHG